MISSHPLAVLDKNLHEAPADVIVLYPQVAILGSSDMKRPVETKTRTGGSDANVNRGWYTRTVWRCHGEIFFPLNAITVADRDLYLECHSFLPAHPENFEVLFLRQANRANAEKSAGPRTIEGKQRASMSAPKHGLAAQTVALPHEDNTA